MPRWVCTYPRPRNIGWPFGVVKPGQIVEHTVKPYPDCFERIAEDDETERPRRGRPPKVIEQAVAEQPKVERRGLTSDIFAPKAKVEEIADDEGVTDNG